MGLWKSHLGSYQTPTDPSLTVYMGNQGPKSGGYIASVCEDGKPTGQIPTGAGTPTLPILLPSFLLSFLH